MSRPITTIIILFFSFMLYTPIISTKIDPINKLINDSCHDTPFESICVESLSPYDWYVNRSRTQKQVAKLALAISLQETKSAYKLVTQHHNSLAKSSTESYLKDCFFQVGVSVDKLNGSLWELRISGSPNSDEYEVHMSNVHTWLSAALMNAGDCKDSLADTNMGDYRTVLKKQMAYASQLISNAFAICNKLVPNS